MLVKSVLFTAQPGNVADRISPFINETLLDGLTPWPEKGCRQSRYYALPTPVLSEGPASAGTVAGGLPVITLGFRASLISGAKGRTPFRSGRTYSGNIS